MARLLTETFDPQDFLLFATGGRGVFQTASVPVDFESFVNTTNNGPPVVAVLKTRPIETYGGCYFRWSGAAGGTLSTDDLILFRSDDILLGKVRINAGHDKLELITNGVVQVIGTENIQIARNYHLQWNYKVGAVTGVFEVKLDEDLDVLTFNGNTLGAGGAVVNRYDLAASNSGTFFESMYINDTTGTEDNTWGGVIPMKSFVPTADDIEEWLLSAGANGWDLLNETPHDSDTTYVYSNVDGQKSSFVCPGHGLLAPSEIRAVSARWVARKVSDGRVRPYFRIDNVDYPIAAASEPVGVGYGVVMDRRTTNPATGLPWELGDLIDSFGLESVL